MRNRTIWHYGTSALIGVYLLFSPLMLGMAEESESTLNALAVGILLLTISVRALINGAYLIMECLRLSLGGWLVLAPFVLSFTSPVTSRNAWIAGTLLIATADIAGLLLATDRMLRAKSRVYRVLRLSPEEIVGYESSKQTLTPKILSRQIVERSKQIRKTLIKADLQVEVEMCVLGYKSCAADMLLLQGLVERSLPQAGCLRRRRLEIARCKAGEALSKTHELLNPGEYTLQEGEKA